MRRAKKPMAEKRAVVCAWSACERLLAAAAGVLAWAAVAGAATLRVCATTPDLADLVRTIGAGHVEVTSFVQGPQDAHFLEARPSFIRALAEADLLVLNGLDLEAGWLPELVRASRNARVQPGAAGYLDAATAIDPLEVPAVVDRSMGDVHALGNPHYLLDPLNGLRVAQAIADRLATLDPDVAEAARRNAVEFANQLARRLVGDALVGIYGVDGAKKLAILFEHGRLRAFLASQGHADLLAGWIARLAPLVDRPAVDEHNLWPYLARRFRLRIVAHLEPKPGIPPTTAHLSDVIDRMRRDGVKLILNAPYYNSRYARFVAERTGARIVELAHQVGSRPGTDRYLDMIEHNVRALAGSGK